MSSSWARFFSTNTVSRSLNATLKSNPSLTPEPLHPPPPKQRSRQALKKRSLQPRPSSVAKGERDLHCWLTRDEDPNGIFQSRDGPIYGSRYSLLWRVRKAVWSEYGQDYRVEMFGSIKYGATSTKSDMDLIVLDRKRPEGFNPHGKKKLAKIYKLHHLANLLRKTGFQDIEMIPASVPIVKFRDPKTGIHCDLNVNDQPGYWNSVMIRRYCNLSPHLRMLLVAIKRWAKPLGLNNPSPTKPGQSVTFSSYAYALMTIGFLQSRGLLPNLQQDIPPNVKEHWFWNRKPVFLCDLRFGLHKELGINHNISTMQLFQDWFEFWANFDPAEQMVDIRLGGVIPRRAMSDGKTLDAISSTTTTTALPPSNVDVDETGNSERMVVVHQPVGGYDEKDLERWEFQTFCVIDPFILVRNVTRNIGHKVFETFQVECRKAIVIMKEVEGRGQFSKAKN